jgi:hypothetical protein
VNLPSGWNYTEWLNADYVLTPDMGAIDQLLQGGFFTPFEGLILESTIIKALMDFEILREASVGRFFEQRMQASVTIHRQTVLAQFDNLSFSTRIPGPKFIFAHILSPHAPFVFGPDGEARVSEGSLNLFEDANLSIEEREMLYLDQLTYVNSRLKEAINAILTQNTRPTIIILQADHGHGYFSGDRENLSSEAILARAGILNAYYVPQTCQDDLYPSITPVNSSRIIFNCLFNGNFQLMEDTTWYGDQGYLPNDEVSPDLYE